MIKRIAVTRVVIWLKLIMNISYVIFYVLFSLGRVFIGCNSSLFMMYLDFWMYSGFPLSLCNIHNILCYSYKVIFCCSFGDILLWFSRQLFSQNVEWHQSFAQLLICFWLKFVSVLCCLIPTDMGCKLITTHKTFRRCPERLLSVVYRFK